MRYTILPSTDPHKALHIRDDEDFLELLRNCVGDDAATYYESRVKALVKDWYELNKLVNKSRSSKLKDDVGNFIADVISEQDWNA